MLLKISRPPCLSIEAEAGTNNRGWARFWGQDHVSTRRRPRSFLIDRNSSIASQEVGIISRLFPPSLSLSLYARNGISIFASSKNHLDLSKSAIVSPAEREMRLCRFPFTFYRRKEFTDKVSWFNGTPLMRDILVDREISTTWSLGELPWGEHAVCPVRFFSFLLSFSHSVW